jgi:flavodoxin
MKALIVYDSYFGNTKEIALAIAQKFESQATVTTCRASEVKLEQLAGLDYLLVGSPTRGFNPSDATKIFLKSIPASALKGIRTAAFDTRIPVKEVNNFLLNILVPIFGYAAEPIAKQLLHKGGVSAGAPAGFVVNKSEGPLKDGELERAAAWAESLIKA